MIAYYQGTNSSYRKSRGRGPSWPQAVRTPRTIPARLGSVLSSLRVDDLSANACPAAQAKITDCEVISSYNLTGKTSTTILVPGAPPAYTPLPYPEPLTDDSRSGGEYFCEENSARFPNHPMEPAVESVFAVVPSFDAASVDVFACGSTLDSLVRFVLEKPQAFSFVVNMVGNTAFFTRRGNSPTELLTDVFGYGHTFPDAYTTWGAGMRDSSSHQRILKYNFGGLKFLLRYESDGYLVREDRAREAEQRETPDPAPLEDMLVDLLKRDERSSNPHVNIELKGHKVDQSDVFDLKTRSIKKIDDDVLQEELPRLWIRQTSNFILAFHKVGVFNEIRVQDVGDTIQEWETSTTSSLRRLACLVDQIISATKEQPSRKLEVRGMEQGTLEFCAVEGEWWDALAQDVAVKWANLDVNDDGGHDHEGEEEDEGDSPWVEGHDHGGEILSPDDEDDDTNDYTACSAEDCGYCGRCSY